MNLRHTTLLLAILLIPEFAGAFQDEPIRFEITIGQSKAEILKGCGKPFGLFRVEDGDENSSAGVPLGQSTVFHLTPFDDRMYATIVHYSDRSDRADALFFQPVGFWSVDQFLRDHPKLAAYCLTSCEMEEVTEIAGNKSLLLRPSVKSTQGYALYFIGDTGSRFRSVTSMQSVVSWVYVIQLTNFQAKHIGYKRETIGEWKPQAK